jgi:hypothetical protein
VEGLLLVLHAGAYLEAGHKLLLQALARRRHLQITNKRSKKTKTKTKTKIPEKTKQPNFFVFLLRFIFREWKKGHAWPQRKTFDSEEEEEVLAE